MVICSMGCGCLIVFCISEHQSDLCKICHVAILEVQGTNLTEVVCTVNMHLRFTCSYFFCVYFKVNNTNKAACHMRNNISIGIASITEAREADSH